MTIVLQHQFENLIVKDDHFSVELSFDNQQEKVVIPFAALTAFADPSVKFGLQFRHTDEAHLNASTSHNESNKPSKITTPKPAKESANNVISLDFRNKKRL